MGQVLRVSLDEIKGYERARNISGYTWSEADKAFPYFSTHVIAMSWDKNGSPTGVIVMNSDTNDWAKVVKGENNALNGVSVTWWD